MLRSKQSTLPQASETTLKTRPATYKNWSATKMRLACEAVRKEGISVCRAAEEYHISKFTIFDRLSGKVEQGAVSGPAKYLKKKRLRWLIF